MKKFILSISALALALVSPVFAENTTSGATDRQMKRDEIRADFRAKLVTLRDQKKKVILERLDTRMKELNANRTATMLRHLTKIEETLNKIETRTNTVAAPGKDVAVVRAAITKARDAIAAARTAVNAQAAKTYTIEITTEANLGSAASTVRTQLAKDLQAAHQMVVTARKAVRDVLVALGKVVGEKLTNTVEK